MTVRELLELLHGQDLDLQVLFSNDEEGNILHTDVDVGIVNVPDHGKRFIFYPLNGDDDIT